MSSCSRRQPRWDSRLSNNQHARPRRMPGGTFDHEVRSGLLKDASPFCYSSKIYSSSNKNNPNCKKRLACGTFRKLTQACGRLRNFPQAHSNVWAFAELSASSLKRAGVCGTFRKFLASVRGVCGTFRKLTQVCGAFAEVSASFSQVCGAFAEVSASSLKCAGRLRNFPQAHSSVRGVCGTFRKHALFLKIVIDFVRKTSDSARRPRGEIRKTAFSVRNTYVRYG